MDANFDDVNALVFGFLKVITYEGILFKYIEISMSSMNVGVIMQQFVSK